MAMDKQMWTIDSLSNQQMEHRRDEIKHKNKRTSPAFSQKRTYFLVRKNKERSVFDRNWWFLSNKPSDFPMYVSLKLNNFRPWNLYFGQHLIIPRKISFYANLLLLQLFNSQYTFNSTKLKISSNAQRTRLFNVSTGGIAERKKNMK